MTTRWLPLASLIAVGLLLALAAGTAGLPWIMPEHDATARRLAAIAHLCRKLRSPGDRQGAGALDRPRRGGTGRRLSHGGIRRRSAAGGLPGCRSTDHHAVARHDDRRRQSAHLWLLCIGQRLGRPPRASTITVAGGHRYGLRRVLRLPGERRDLPGHGAAGAGVDIGPEAQSGAVSAGRCNGIECRVNGDDHRQPAEHDDRQLFTYPVSAVRRRPGASRAGRTAADGRAAGAAAPQRTARWRAGRSRAAAADQPQC